MGRSELASLPLPVRCAVIGACVAGLLGGVAGLVVGLLVHPPTAWFAVIELGVPSAVLGAAVGLGVGGLVAAVTRLRTASGGPSDPPRAEPLSARCSPE